MTKSEIERVQAYLRRLLATERIRVVAPVRAGMSIEVAVGDEVIGTLHRDAEDGEVSYAVHLTILEEDLAPAAAPAAPGRPAAAARPAPKTTPKPRSTR
ncbi:DUF3126 family protein [Roseomonas nepalensis]|uniref:DUF3126 family protein n=1 Tax=Muricoccus nepalensis TaxID=1854500 RepID=A0A502FAJ0_9PROT|nr:DUF3126 family protein [Roseomonas nepalensis]TPG46353.1 DUF3126 family protein [Roseomonas nepalensis]